MPAAEHVRQVYLDKENGVIAAPKNDDRLMLECSTIDTQTTRDVGKAIIDAGTGRYIDAPVSVSTFGSMQFWFSTDCDRAARKERQQEL